MPMPANPANHQPHQHEGITREALGERPERTGNLRCPHCQCIGHVRSSQAETPQHRKNYYQCTNVLCGHTWLATLSYEYGIVPSAIPDPRVTLPLRTMPRQQVMELLRDKDPSQPDMFDPKSSPDTG